MANFFKFQLFSILAILSCRWEKSHFVYSVKQSCCRRKLTILFPLILKHFFTLLEFHSNGVTLPLKYFIQQGLYDNVPTCKTRTEAWRYHSGKAKPRILGRQWWVLYWLSLACHRMVYRLELCHRYTNKQHEKREPLHLADGFFKHGHRENSCGKNLQLIGNLWTMLKETSGIKFTAKVWILSKQCCR